MSESKNDIPYENYILDHQENVMKAYNEYGDTILKIMDNASLSSQLLKLVKCHDQTKFSKEEFEGYRKYYYPTEDEDKDDAKGEADLAWLHHMNFNQHHPEYWVLRDKEGPKTLDMERVYLVEMILDWIAMGYRFKNTALSWWEKNKNYFSTVMSKSTYNTVDHTITELYNSERGK